MPHAEELIRRVRARGSNLEIMADGKIKPVGNAMPQKLMLELKANREEVYAALMAEKETEIQCDVCKATWFEEPTSELAWMFCELGMLTRKAQGCPYKRNRD